ncbi:MAG: dTDP-4-dehydrorhamnose reductase [Magnetococcales bacterium]|nr:dTDP-4-dehydrorhamnose reductase [Magnetococcales bacterium]
MDAKKLLITGAAGQVGKEIATLAPERGWRTVALDQTELDITNPASVHETILALRPDAILNAAAYTAVDRAETEPDIAFTINRDGPRHLAEAAKSRHIPLLHISTDYVFDGLQSTPYQESDPAAPLGVYGASKLAGDEAIRATWPRHILLRVSWVFGQHGANFVRTILRLARERDTLRVVEDQIGGPTPAPAIADTLLQLADLAIRPGFDAWGTYHYCGAPALSWHAFARFIIDAARLPCACLPIPTTDYPTPARRPANSRLECKKIQDRFAIPQPDWRPHALDMIRRLSP